jgi:hypothetical protein
VAHDRSTLRRVLVASSVGTLFAAALVLAPSLARADDRPPTSHLLLAGAGMAIPTYMIGVAAHEGSHALAAVISGAEVTRIQLLPGLHPRTGKFYFGYVEVSGLRCTRQRASFLLAPKLTDAVVLGAYAAAFFGGAYPDDRYGQLALTVLATGFWVDFSKDIVAFWDHSDLVKVYRLAGADDELERLPYRLLHAGLAAAGSIAIAKGYRRIFGSDDDDGDGAAMAAVAALPLWSGVF